MKFRPAWGLLLVSLTPGPGLGDDAADAPRRPDRVTPLFNGRDLAGLTTWLEDARRDDPRRVFTVAPDGSLRISGDGFGYVGTARPYRDYRLVVEYRWGERTAGKSVRNSGILLNAVGPDGGVRNTWMPSVEVQLAQGCVGDLVVIRNDPAEVPGATPVRFTADSADGPDGHPRWRAEGGAPRTFESGQFWWTRHDPEFGEQLDTRGRDDVESPKGEWTRVECTVDGDRIAVRVNGVLVNECRAVSPAGGGRILLQTEGSELFVRAFELHPLR